LKFSYRTLWSVQLPKPRFLSAVFGPGESTLGRPTFTVEGSVNLPAVNGLGVKGDSGTFADARKNRLMYSSSSSSAPASRIRTRLLAARPAWQSAAAAPKLPGRDTCPIRPKLLATAASYHVIAYCAFFQGVWRAAMHVSDG